MIKKLNNYSYSFRFTRKIFTESTIEVFILDKKLWKTSLKRFLDILIQEGYIRSYAVYYSGFYRYTVNLNSKTRFYDY